MHRLRLLASGPALALVPLLATAPPASAQLAFGVHGARANETDGGAWGGGAKVELTLPALPVGVVLAGDYFDLDEGSLLGWSLDAKAAFPFPVVRPYGTAGVVTRRLDPGDDDDPETDAETDTGIGLGVGVDADAVAVRLFAEARYEFVGNDQVVWRFGVVF